MGNTIMHTKLVYLLTSDETDYYLEQTLMSVYSCRLHNPAAHIALVTDSLTLQTCETGLRKHFLTHFDEIVTVDTSAFPDKMRRSRILKTTLRQHIDGDYLFIDSDTIICESLAEIDHLDAKIGMVADIHDTKEHWQLNYGNYMYPHIHRHLKSDCYYNSGVMYVKDCEMTREFYRQWHAQWLKMCTSGLKTHLDQPSLNWIISENGYDITSLDGIWNCQISYNGLRFLYRAKILHYYTSIKTDNAFLLADTDIYREIKKSGELTGRVIDLIEHPKEAFTHHNHVYGPRDARMRKSPGVFRAIYLYSQSQPLYRVLSGFTKILMAIHVFDRKIRKKR